MNEQQLLGDILMSVMHPPIAIHEQCETREMNLGATIHLPKAKFDIVVNHLGSSGKEEHEIAISLNGNAYCTTAMVVSNKTNVSIPIKEPQVVLEALIYSEITKKNIARFMTG